MIGCLQDLIEFQEEEKLNNEVPRTDCVVDHEKLKWMVRVILNTCVSTVNFLSFLLLQQPTYNSHNLNPAAIQPTLFLVQPRSSRELLQCRKCLNKELNNCSGIRPHHYNIQIFGLMCIYFLKN